MIHKSSSTFSASSELPGNGRIGDTRARLRVYLNQCLRAVSTAGSDDFLYLARTNLRDSLIKPCACKRHRLVDRSNCHDYSYDCVATVILILSHILLCQSNRQAPTRTGLTQTILSCRATRSRNMSSTNTDRSVGLSFIAY